MSTRTYPLWKPGAPQLRIFMPDFLMKLIKPKKPMPKNILQFEVDLKMSDTDVKNYLVKIYGAPVMHVRTHITRGDRFRHPKSGSDADHFLPDIKHAYVTMEKGYRFQWPELVDETSQKESGKEFEEFDNAIQRMRVQRKQHWTRSGAPTWFGA